MVFIDAVPISESEIAKFDVNSAIISLPFIIATIIIKTAKKP